LESHNDEAMFYSRMKDMSYLMYDDASSKTTMS